MFKFQQTDLFTPVVQAQAATMLKKDMKSGMMEILNKIF